MGRMKAAKKFEDVYGATPRNYHWRRIISYEPIIERSELGSLGQCIYNSFNKLKPLEQIYIRDLKPAFDIWLEIVLKQKEEERTQLAKEILQPPLEVFMAFDRSGVYDTIFHYLIKDDVTNDFLMEELNKLLDNDSVPYTNFFDVSCYFFIYATINFTESDVGNAEENNIRAMYEAIRYLNKFMHRHEAYLQEKMNNIKKEASKKGGENRSLKLRTLVVKILKEEALKGNDNFKNAQALTLYLCDEIKKNSKNKEMVLQCDLFDTIYGWSESAKSDISILYWMLIKKD